MRALVSTSWQTYPSRSNSAPSVSEGQGVRQTLAKLGIRPRKALGQHFLHDRSVVQRIVQVAALQPGTLVVEIGPGLGILTEELVRAGSTVLAIELDPTLAHYLTEKFRGQSVRIVQGDALAIDLASPVGDHPYVVVANLPYNVATPILTSLLTSEHPPERLVVMVQREVAERMVATPPAMSALSVVIQFFTSPRIAFRVGAGAFIPPPKVESAVVVLERHDPPLPREEWNDFFQFVRAGFAQRRKQLRNTLVTGLNRSKETVSQLLLRASITPTRRAETLSLGEWIRLYNAWREERSQCASQ